MTALLGSSLGVFIGLTVILVGGCAFLMGQAIASTWRSPWQILPYGLLLAAANRFLVFALFGGELLAVLPYLVAALVVLILALVGYRLTQVDLMINQYPWLYERAGIAGWRDKEGAP